MIPTDCDDWQETPLKVLVVEDHDGLREVMIETLEAHGFRAVGVDCAEAVCELPQPADYALAVLDLNLPGEDGLSLARRLRAARPELGIVMVTVRDQLPDKVTGYDQGADLYLCKPVAALELTAAVRALARRLRPQPNLDRRMCLDQNMRTLNFPNGSLSLTADESRLLAALALAEGQCMESWQLLELLDRDLSDQGKKQLEVLVSRLRRKLKERGLPPTLIRAERGHGYRLCAPLRLL